MKPAPFAYLAPHSLDEAVAALARHDAQPLAGGQSLVPMLALRLARPGLVVDLNRIPGLAGIREEGAEIRIGAMTRQAAVLASPLIARRLPLIAQALAEVGHPPTRARGTVGGSLSHADPAAELPAVMLAEEARMVIRGPLGERILSATAFFCGILETAMGQGELLTEIRIPAPQGMVGTGFAEVAQRKGDFAIALAAAKIGLDDDGRCNLARVVVGAVAPTPLRCTAIETRLLGRPLDGAGLASAIAAFPESEIATDDQAASRSYRVAVAPVVIRRALETALAKAGKGA
jgi:aerobic carbon-monoxide dehydrogenase medium subunit